MWASLYPLLIIIVVVVSFQYYTRRYSRPNSQPLDEQLNISLPSKRPSLPVGDQSTKSTAVVVVSTSPVDASRRTGTIYHHHVTSFCEPPASLANRQLSAAAADSNSFVTVKPANSQSSCSRSLIIVQVSVRTNAEHSLFAHATHHYSSIKGCQRIDTLVCFRASVVSSSPKRCAAR